MSGLLSLSRSIALCLCLLAVFVDTVSAARSFSPISLRAAVFPSDLVGNAQGYHWETSIGLHRALRAYPGMDIVYSFDGAVARHFGVKVLPLSEEETEGLWIKSSRFLLGEPNVELVLSIAKRLDLDVVVMFALDLSLGNLKDVDAYLVDDQRVVLIDARRKRAFAYRSKSMTTALDTVGPSLSRNLLNRVLRVFRDSVRGER